MSIESPSGKKTTLLKIKKLIVFIEVQSNFYKFFLEDSMGILTKAEITALVNAGQKVILRNGNIFILVDTSAEIPASDQAVIDGATEIFIGGPINLLQDTSWAEGVDIVLGTTTGSKIGTGATQKLGFYGATPVVRPVGAEQASITDNSAGSAGASVETAGASYDATTRTNLNNAVATLTQRINALRSALVSVGIIKGSS